MATWGSHFRITENILRSYRNYDLEIKNFTIGNIAPDGGTPNENWSKFTPSKDVSHFFLKNGLDFLINESKFFLIRDIDFYIKYVSDIDKINDNIRYSFLFGYFIHLLTDNLWNYFIMRPLKEKYLKELQKDSNFIWKVKTDWYDLDKIYLTEHKNGVFWTYFLEAEYSESFLDFLPKEGINRQMEYIKKLYQISNNEYERISARKFTFLNKNEMNKFVNNSTELILDVLAKIEEKKVGFKEKTSFLDNLIKWE
jgi:hypothetical protein